MPAAFLPAVLGRAANTWLIDYQPVIEQSLADLVAWVEGDVEPAATNWEYRDGKSRRGCGPPGWGRKVAVDALKLTWGHPRENLDRF